MQDKIVVLNKDDFTEDIWFKLSIEFDFDNKDTRAYIHVLKD